MGSTLVIALHSDYYYTVCNSSLKNITDSCLMRLCYVLTIHVQGIPFGLTQM